MPNRRPRNPANFFHPSHSYSNILTIGAKLYDNNNNNNNNNNNIIKHLFNVGHIHLQNFHFIAQANKNQP